MAERTVAQLQQLIDYSKTLGFWDDVAHWTAELKKKKEAANV